MRGAKLTVAVSQMKFRETIRENVAWITSTIQASARAGADVVLFPECALTGYNRNFLAIARIELDAARATLAAVARAAHCNVLVGGPTFIRKNRFNSLLIYDRHGHEVFCYSKIHLTPRDARYFKPGNRLAFFHLDCIPCTAIICHAIGQFHLAGH